MTPQPSIPDERPVDLPGADWLHCPVCGSPVYNSASGWNAHVHSLPKGYVLVNADMLAAALLAADERIVEAYPEERDNLIGPEHDKGRSEYVAAILAAIQEQTDGRQG